MSTALTNGGQLLPATAGPAAPRRPPVGAPLLAGFLLLSLGIGGFGAWADRAPLASAAISYGTVAVDSKRKVVQHVEGGAIAEILVREGDRVQEGQVLLRLDDLEAKALHDILERQYLALLAQESRLRAEQASAGRVAFPPPLAEHLARPEIAEILAGQMQIFDSGRAALQGQIQVLRQRGAEMEAQIGALQSQLLSGQEQLAIIEEEAASVRALVDKGLERKPRLLMLMRTKAFLKGQQGEYANRIAQVRESIAEIELEVLNAARTRIERAALELGQVAAERAGTEQRLAQAGVKLGRRDVVAPISGLVLGLRHHTVGGVVQPGRDILEIVPENDDLVVETQVAPTDIDVVRAGLPARVVLSGVKRRTTPQIDGTVLQVSADAIEDQQSGRRFYLARIAIDRAALAQADGIELTPGMPAEVFIQTGSRSALDYFLEPVTDSLRRAFREQ